ncbi:MULTISPECIES: hypothetical protein [Methylobacterium]|uniref:Uncharacterized protein n=1 Tax=Methylobacterium jeotgali TaxID=381630 RepID=A0ABQ4T4P5_9HYPH|nr:MULTISPECIES: hypothetical protein [Methylobacterium]GBU19959.1 hypothetical protein AwMethylo_41740 [Methylobacterium sp.]GJE08886.1 hypothetical protein AOPFMNJM_4232 [Methylobacterium jeotgali]
MTDRTDHEGRTGAPRDGLIALAVAALVAATVLLGALLPARHGPAPVAGDPAADPACQEWGDGCRVCRRLPGEVACSLPGIACTPQPPRCLIRGDG